MWATRCIVHQATHPSLLPLDLFPPGSRLAPSHPRQVNGVVLKYQPPAESCKPDKKWRLFVFKGEQELEAIKLHR